MPTPDSPDWEFSRRDVLILQELSRNPQLSSREIARILDRKHGIDVSHVTVSETIRGMREEKVFREAIIPNEEYFSFALFEFKFNAEHFAERWRPAMEQISDSPNTLFYFLADGDYQWKAVMMFRSRETQSKWIHDFYKEYGDAVDNIRSTVVYNLLKFQTDPEILESFSEPDD